MNAELRLLQDILRGGPGAVDAMRRLAHTDFGHRLLALIAERGAFTLLLERDGQVVSELRLLGSARIPNVGAGHYTLTLDSGRVLWDETLSASQVVLTAPLRAAAQTGDFAATPTLQREIAGAIRLSVYPGVSGGTIVCETL
jgi:hypothetical protein